MRKYQPPTKNYFRMYNRVFDLDLKATTFLLYSYLVCCAGNKCYCWPSLDTIRRKTGLSISTIEEHLKILEQRQLIRKSKHRNTDRKRNNVYTLLSLDNPEVYRDLVPAAEELPLCIGEELPL